MISENSLTGRLKRYAHVTTTAGGLMARLLGDRYLGFSLDPLRYAHDLKTTLGGLKGPLMKIAQMLATVPDMVPPEYATAFLELQSQAPPMGWPFVKRRMQAELGPAWQQDFQQFDPQATAAASLGQVHKARDLTGQLLACKLQYPEMGAAVEADLGQLKLVLKSFDLYSGALETTQVYAEIADRLWEELDYLGEAKNIELFKIMLSPFSFVHVPQVKKELTTSRLLTMTWLEGSPLLTFRETPQEVRNAISTSLFKAWYTPLYHYGILHGDPHLGNYSWSQDEKLNLLDFGCVRVFKGTFVQGVVDLYRALQTQNEDLAVHAYQTWGFSKLDKDLIEILNGWARFLYEPFLRDGVGPLEETYSGLKGRKLAGDILRALKNKGGVTPPREFVFMDRAAVGIGSVFIHLKAHLNWHQLFEDMIQDFSSASLQASQDHLLKD